MPSIGAFGLSTRLGWPVRAPQKLKVWFDPGYRLPLAHGEALSEAALGRAELAMWCLLDRARGHVLAQVPERVSHAALAAVHRGDYLEAVTRPEILARIFAAAPQGLAVDRLLDAVRLAVGGTVAATRAALLERRATLNLAGGFHHAAPDHGGGYCVFNDVAVALAAVRAEGFSGQVAVLDLDAHPPDGTAACLQGDAAIWMGSLEGSDWGAFPGVTQVLLPEGSGDRVYLDALARLLGEMPRADLTFVLAGGDVLAGDPHGRLGLSVSGARQRDLRVLASLRGIPSVWLAAGGYTPDAWRVLAGTGLVLCGLPRRRIPDGYDPLAKHFRHVARTLSPEQLGEVSQISDADLDADLHMPGRAGHLLFGFYSAQGIEYALYQYGIVERLASLGYGAVRVEIGVADIGERVIVFARGPDGREHRVIECVLERRSSGDEPVLYLHWLSLMNPLAPFSAGRSPLPGQTFPGLGLGRETVAMLDQMARRLDLSGLALRPSHLHVAFAARAHFQFVDPARQGRFEALLRDLGPTPLFELTSAMEAGRVRLNGAPYPWEADEMVHWLAPHPRDAAAIERARSQSHFAIEPAAGAPGREPP